MKNSKTQFADFVARITLDEPQAEKECIGELVFDHLFDVSRTDIIAEKPIEVWDDDMRRIDDIILRINQSEPIQYILGVAEFFGRPFIVNSSVLIPRPETEELVWRVIQFASRNRLHAPAIVDIGCGSGCIPVTLACELPDAAVSGTDISEGALAVARANAELHGVAVDMRVHDILSGEIPFTDVDIITSNPPYIPDTEKNSLDANVVKYEPHVALFVASRDPFLFYRAIGASALRRLRPGGLLVVEINERYGQEVADLFSSFQNVEIIKDINGKDRMVSAIRPIG